MARPRLAAVLARCLMSRIEAWQQERTGPTSHESQSTLLPQHFRVTACIAIDCDCSACISAGTTKPKVARSTELLVLTRQQQVHGSCVQARRLHYSTNKLYYIT
eukprot:2243545-Amphidinium_carterae.1